MLWLLSSGFFSWCAYREIRGSLIAPAGYDFPSPINHAYLTVVLVAAVLCAWPPLHTWHFEHFLSEKATALADGHRATVHCNTLFDTMMDTEMLASGHANPYTGKIAIQDPWCGTLMSYLRHPDRAGGEEIFSLALFTHESMHIRGELDEARTECQAVQRNYRAARLLGVPDVIAKRNALAYYTSLYRARAAEGPMQREYYSEDCAPGRAWDEHLGDSTWGP